MKKALIRGEDGKNRCFWANSDPLYLSYHDDEWGLPMHDDTRLFEKICLEGFQAGLSWLTILKKRENFRKAFSGFQIEKVARFNKRSVERLLNDKGIVRHRGKIVSTINNAQRALELIDEKGSLDAYFWDFVPPKNERPQRITLTTLKELSQTQTSTALSKDLKQRGWTFVGPTTAYAFMQAMGLVDDHMDGCECKAGG